MRLRHAQHAQREGRSVWPSPRILPWSAWLRQERLEARAFNVSKTAERLLTPAQARLLWDEIVADSAWGRTLLVPANAARLVARSWQRLHDYLIPLERLEQFDTPETQALLGWCRDFQNRCAALNAIDESRLAHWMHASDFVPAHRLTFAGFDEIPPAIARLISQWSAAGKIVVADEAVARAGDVRSVAAPDAEAEIALAAHWARQQLAAGASSIGVILNDLSTRHDEVRRVFADVFAPASRHTLHAAAEIPVVIAAPAPLISYPLIDAAVLVLRLCAMGGDSTLIGRLLRSPFIGAGESERNRRALADLRLRNEQRDRWDWFEFERWAGVTTCDQLQLAAREVSALIRSEFSSASASEWAARFQIVLQRIGWPGDRTLTSVEHQTLGKFMDALAEFGTLELLAGRMNARQAIGRFQDVLRDIPFEPEAGQGAVIVIDAMTSAGMEFDALWIAGLQADRMPSPVSPDALIPLELQREAGVPEATAQGSLRRAQTQFDRWMRSARTIRLSWPQREGDAELTMSPMLTEFSAVQLGAGLPHALRQTFFDHRPQLDVVTDDRAPTLDAGSARGGAAILELQSRCPFKAQGQLRLRADPMPQVNLGVDAPDRGAILHGVLEEVWGSLRTQQALLELPNDVLEQRVHAIAQRLVAKQLRPDTRVRERLASLETANTVRQVMQLLAIERQRPPFTVRFAEAAEHFSIGGLAVTLRPDRIDELIGGGELLIDYKLGDANRPRDWLDVWPGRPRRPQLPLYGLAHGERLRALAFVVLAPGKVEYRGWSDGAPVGPGVDAYPPYRLRLDLGDAMDWQALQHQWQFTLTRLAQAFVAGEASVDPLPRECDICHLSTLCRVHELARNARTESADG